LPKLIDDVAEYMKRFIISVSGKPKAVLISAEELESLEETAEILSDPQSFKSIMRGYRQAKAGRGKLLQDFLIHDKSVSYRTGRQRSKRTASR